MVRCVLMRRAMSTPAATATLAKPIERSQTIAEVVLEHAACAKVFKGHRIDFCCRGGVSVEAAAAEKGLEVDALLAELTTAVLERTGEPPSDLRALGTPELVAHVNTKHHEYLRKALPFVRGLAMKVARVHGDHNPKLRDLDAAVARLHDSLLEHIEEEERVTFDALTQPGSDPKAIAKLLAEMTEEHLEVADLLTQIRSASDDFTLPSWACTSYRTLFAELADIESDTFAHVHIENHVLAPRFATP